ncbi:MAG: outer membrane protein assembly factor BamE, partial [Ardenticatenia bacterium]
MRRVALLVAALASLLVLAACGGQTSETSEVVKEVTKVVTQVVEGETVEKV